MEENDSVQVRRSVLTRCAAASDRMRDAASAAMALIGRGELAEARAMARSASEAAEQVYQSLVTAGAKPTTGRAPRPVSLHLLDTASTRALLALLRAALEEAERVDAERGHVLPADYRLHSGESRGTGWAETLANLVEQLREEIEGPSGPGRE